MEASIDLSAALNLNLILPGVQTRVTSIRMPKLIEVGFDYVTEMDGARLFRKRK